MTKNNITTIEGLAEMIQRTMASKKDVQALDKQVEALDTKVTEGGTVALALLFVRLLNDPVCGVIGVEHTQGSRPKHSPRRGTVLS
jgi:hypothetical protein